MSSTDDIARAAACARRYRDWGLSPVPSREDAKRPALASYAEHRREPLPERRYRDWGTSNVQLLTGCNAYGPTKVVTVDCDGEPAQRCWAAIRKRFAWDEPTWVVRSGSGSGRHWYFAVPPGVEAVPSGLLWGLWDTWGENGSGGWVRHQRIDLLGDGNQAVAPPSLHVDTGGRYEFDGRKPDIARLAAAPPWLLGMPRLAAPRQPKSDRSAVNMLSNANAGRPLAGPRGGPWRRDEVLAAIPDKAALAASWGLRLAAQGPNPAGWVSCHAVGRDDERPSASVHVETGVYQDRGDMTSAAFFDLGVKLGRFATWAECLDWCGEHYLGGSRPYRQALACGSRAARA